MSTVTALTGITEWGKPTVYYDHSLSGLTATGSATGHLVANIIDRLENNYWLSDDDGGQNDICYDSGSSEGYTADYFAINGHNFANVGATVKLEYSDTLDLSTPANAGTEAGSIASIPDEDNTPFVVEFTSVSARYWRLRIEQTSVIGDEFPKITNGYWGEKTELDYATSGFDPNTSKYDDLVNISQTGILLGIHKKQRIRRFSFSIREAESEIFDKAEMLFETVGLEPFFVCWNYVNNSSDCYYMRSDSGIFTAPHVIGNGGYRNLNFNFIGRVGAWQ